MSICRFCATGADMQKRAIEISPTNRIDEAVISDLQEVGVHLHSYCKGKIHCDCQHHPVGAGNIQ